MAYYYSIPIEEMEEELESLRFYPVNLVFRNKPVKEWVYERKLPRSKNHFVRIYTGIQRYGQSAGESRKAGKDAIRIQVIYRDAKGETLVSQTKRVHRVGGWRKNLHKRMDEVATELPQVEFDSRGEPMTLRKKGKNQFWGSRDYPKYKETKPFRAEEIRCCKECDKTTGLTTIQAGTYCYDCLPINLGAEEIVCPKCDWSWQRSEGGDDLFTCHKCGFDHETYHAEDRLDYRDYLNDLRSYPELKNLSDEQLLARGIDCLASQTANRETFAAEEMFYYHSTDMTNLESILKEGIRPTADTNSTWGEEIIDISPYPYYYGEIDDILPSVFVADSPEEARWWADEAGIDKIVVLKISSQVENLENFHGDGNGYKTSETIPKEYIVDVIGETFAAETYHSEDDYDATYGKAQATIRRKLKNKIKKQAIMGTKAGQWSARKSQELKRQYEAACDKKGLNPYKGKKTKSQDNLSKWSKQKWGTASGKKSSTTGEPYFPAKAVAALKKKDLYAKAKRQKAKATRAGKQNARYSDDIRKVVAQYRAESPEWDDVDWDSEVPPKYKDEEWVEEIEWDAEDDEITLKEFDDTTADDFVDDSDDRIALMLRKKSKINRYGDIGCPVCGSIGLFSEEIIAKGKKWYCFGCLYEDKEETIKGKGDITLEKYGLEITCPICKKAVKAFNNDSMLRHMKKCGVPK